MFAVTYVLLAAVLACISVILLRVLKDTVRLIVGRRRAQQPNGPLLGDKLPRFRSLAIGTSELIRADDLRGNSTALLFLDPARVLRGADVDSDVSTYLRIVLSTVNGRVLVACNIGETVAAELREMFHDVGNRLALIGEPESLAAQFNVGEFPTVVVVDENGIVEKVGRIGAGAPSFGVTAVA